MNLNQIDLFYFYFILFFYEFEAAEIKFQYLNESHWSHWFVSLCPSFVSSLDQKPYARLRWSDIYLYPTTGRLTIK